MFQLQKKKIQKKTTQRLQTLSLQNKLKLSLGNLKLNLGMVYVSFDSTLMLVVLNFQAISLLIYFVKSPVYL